MKFAIVRRLDAENNRALLNASTSADFSHVRTDDSGNYYFFGFLDKKTPEVYKKYPVVDLEKAKELLLPENSDELESLKYISNNKSTTYPFADKVLPDGKKLFKRVHGVSASFNNETKKIEFVIPYNECKITGVEILNCNYGDTANLNVYDSSTGIISGFPNVKLNQFGFNVFINEKYHKETSNYDADLFLGMKVSVEITASQQKDIYVNFILHEVRS